MRVLLVLISIMAVGWAGYWFVGQAGLAHGWATWVDTQRAKGWVIEHSGLDVRGFPNRFDTNLTDLKLADPASGLGWEAPFFQIFALSYRPNHLIAVWPHTQQITTPRGNVQVDSNDMRASVVLSANADLPLDRATLTAQALAVTPQGTTNPVTATSLRFAAERQPARPATYRLGLLAEGLTPPPDWHAQLDPSRQLPDAFDAFNADLLVRFDQPWDRTALAPPGPQPEEITLKRAEIRWGIMQVLATGKVSIDEQGIPEGEISITAQNWREMLDLAVTSGAVPEPLARPLETVMAQLADGTDTLNIPLRFADGTMQLGPLPLGPAPVLRLR